MRKNGSRLISLRQYRFTDLFLFAVILVGFELILHFAFIAFNGEYTYSPMVPIVLLVIMRWGWQGIFYAVGDGLLYCLLNMGAAGFENYLFAVYIIGNAFIMLVLIMTRFMGKERIRGKWYYSALFVVAGWLAVAVGKTVVAVCFGQNFVSTLLSQVWDLISLAVGLVLILIARRLEGMFEDQKHYLIRLDEERKERIRRDEFGDEPIDIDEDTLSILKKWDDGLGN